MSADARPSDIGLDLSQCDYLGLGNDSRLAEVSAREIERGISDIFMSGVYAQYLSLQNDFEQSVAEFFETESAVLCQSGFAANDGLVQCLADAETPAYIDTLAHPSLRLGARHSDAEIHVFRRNDPGHLHDLIARHGPGVVAVEAVNGFTGAVCDLAGILDITERMGCVVVLNESHSVGVVGGGRGLASALGLADRVPIRVFSLSKAFGCRGALIVGPEIILRWFRFDSMPAIFSSAVLPFEIARFGLALDIVRREDWRRQALARVSRRVRQGLGEPIDDTSPGTHILSLVEPSDRKAAALHHALERRGVAGSLVHPDAAPGGEYTVRLALQAGLTDQQADSLVAAIGESRQEIENLEIMKGTVRVGDGFVAG